MRKAAIYQQMRLLEYVEPKFPSTRYQGSKAKLVDWIWQQVADLRFSSCLDAFGGTGAVAYRLKRAGKRVTYNDLLRFNYYFGLALIENRDVRLSRQQVDWIVTRHPGFEYPTFVYDTFHGVYFTDEENQWVDTVLFNIGKLENRYEFALAFFALSQACIVKRPYNLFHRKNLYIRLAEVERSFGNKASWDAPFEQWFRVFVEEANQAVFDNGQTNRCVNSDALEVPGEYDLVYIDTPYMSGRGVAVDYLDFYHFLEGLTMYEDWREHIDYRSKHRRLRLPESAWTQKARIHGAFDRLFQRYQKSMLVVSYRSDGIPSEKELVELMRQYKATVQSVHYGQYKYVLSHNGESKEILLIGT